MSIARAGQAGATRVCPHCKATVLESAAICPGCRHHLRFNETQRAEPYCAFSIDGTIAHKVSSEPCEFCVVVDVSNERGEKVLRQVVGVGALQPGERRRLNVSVEMLPVVQQTQSRSATSAAGTATQDPRTRPVAASPVPTRSAAATTAPAPQGPARPPGAPASPTSSAPAASAPVGPADKLQLRPPVPGAPPAQRLRTFRKP